MLPREALLGQLQKRGNCCLDRENNSRRILENLELKFCCVNLGATLLRGSGGRNYLNCSFVNLGLQGDYYENHDFSSNEDY